MFTTLTVLFCTQIPGPSGNSINSCSERFRSYYIRKSDLKSCLTLFYHLKTEEGWRVNQEYSRITTRDGIELDVLQKCKDLIK